VLFFTTTSFPSANEIVIVFPAGAATCSRGASRRSAMNPAFPLATPIRTP
jgi:hypothetical protein